MNPLRVLSTSDRRAILLGVAGMAVILTGGRLLPALRTRLAYEREAAVTATRQQNVTRALLADSARLRRDLLVAEVTRRSLDDSLLAAVSPAAAAAALSSLVERAGTTERVRLGSSLGIGDTVFVAGYARVGVRAFAIADVPGLVRWIQRLERDPRGLAIREVTISQPEPAADESVPDALRVEVVIEALVRDRARGGAGR